MRVGYAQLNTTVGDLEGNMTLGIDAYEQLCGRGVDLVVFRAFPVRLSAKRSTA